MSKSKSLKTHQTNKIYAREGNTISGSANLAEINRVEIASWYASPVHPYVGEELYGVGYHLGSCPNAEQSSRHIVSLPLTHSLSGDFIEKLKRTLV